MDSWVKVHTSSKYEGAHGAMTMGYYERADLPFYYALADAFTLCDALPLLDPRARPIPNRLMANSGTIDPAGTHGGPVTDTNRRPTSCGTARGRRCRRCWRTQGVSWKVYSPSNAGVTGKYASLAQYPTLEPGALQPDTNPEVMAASDHVLPYFTAFRNPFRRCTTKAFTPDLPQRLRGRRQLRVACRSVSWIIPPLGFDEHPSSAPANGMYFTSLVLDALTVEPEGVVEDGASS